MSEQLDNELKNRINKVFDNYEDTTPADEGWRLLREKFPEKKKRPVIALWWSAAAVFLLLGIIGTWMFTNQQKSDAVAVKPLSKSGAIEHLNHPGADTTVNAANERSDENDTPVTKQQYLAKARKQHTEPLNPLSEQPQALPVFPIPGATKVPQKAVNTVENKGQVLVYGNPQTAISKTPTVDSVNQIIDNKQIKNNTLAKQNATEPQKAVFGSPDSAKADGTSKMSIYLANEQKKEAAQKKNSVVKASVDKKILYNVYAATYFNYAEGSKSQINTGAGFGTDIKLAGNFKLSTGIAIGRNTLDYSGQPAQTNLVRDAVRAASIQGQGSVSDVAADPAYASFGFSSLKVLASPVVSGYNISLTGLDVPVNLKYEFNPKKSDSYIAAGLSSGTFITETYNYSYDNSVNALGAFPSIPDASVSRSFSRFDFARTLNLSLGMGYQITKGNRLIIEPFLKYPLSGVGSQNLRFGSGGINLRLKFQGAGSKK